MPDDGAESPDAGRVTGPLSEAEFIKQMKVAGQRLEEAQEKLRGITGEGSAANDMIHVVTDGNGGLTSLTLSPRIRRLDSETLAEELTKAVKEAQADARRKTKDATVQALGEDLWSEAHDPGRFGEQLQEIQEDLARSIEGHLSVIEGKLSARRW